MQIAALDNVHLHWREDGDANGYPVVFANSLGTDLRLWDQVVALLPANLRLIRYDKRGHGLSSCPKGPYTIADLTDDAEQLLSHLGVDECIFVGLSVGGMIAQSLAARRPDLVRAMVLSNTGAKMGEPGMWQTRIRAVQEAGLEPIGDAILERWFGPEFRATNEAIAWRNMLIRTPCEGYVGCCQAIADADLSTATSTLSLPVLGIAGSDDLASPPDLVAETASLITGSQFVTIESTGHLPCVENAPLYARHLTAFINGNLP